LGVVCKFGRKFVFWKSNLRGGIKRISIMMSFMGKHGGVLGTIVGVKFGGLSTLGDLTIGGMGMTWGMGICSSTLKSRGIKHSFCPFIGS
jgi:hypothetical protein